MLEAVGVGAVAQNAKLSHSDPMFDWRLVTAVRILCASREQELGDLDSYQLGSLDASAPREVEVSVLQKRWTNQNMDKFCAWWKTCLVQPIEQPHKASSTRNFTS